MSSRLEARGIVVRYAGKAVLDGASLRLEAGAVVVLEGASGSGKSTLLRVIATLRQPDEGEVLLDSVAADAVGPREFRRRVAFVPQHPPMLEGTVADNVGVGPRLHARPISRERVCELLEQVGLGRDDAFLDRRAEDLSGGERQRLALARALANEPTFMLLDEPTAALDPAAAKHVIEGIVSLAARGLGLVVVTHQREHAEALGGARYECVSGKLSTSSSARASEEP